MKHWTIKKRIVLGFATTILLGVVLAGSSWFLLGNIRNNLEHITADALPAMGAAGKLIQNVGLIQISVLRHPLAKSAEEKKELETQIDAWLSENTKTLDEYSKTITRAEDRTNYEKLKETRTPYGKARTQFFELSNAGKMDEAAAFNKSTVRPAFADFQNAAFAIFSTNSKYGQQAALDIHRTIQQAEWTLAAVSLISILLGAALAFVIITGLTKVLTHVASALNDGSSQVAAAAGQVSASSQSLAEGSSEQAASLEETSSSLEEMSSMTKKNTENAQRSNDLAKQARTAAETGATDMQTMAAAMNDIKGSSDEVAKIIKTIDEIAFQTNILALNAAVEAARAGEAGMGFAVVADEVRNLAQRAAQAAKETSGKIETAVSKTSQGVQISAKVAQSLQEIVAKVRQVDELVAEVAAASREQSQGIDQVNTAVSQMDKVTQSNAANAEESASAAEELNAQAEVLREAVGELLKLVNGNKQATNEVPSAKTLVAKVIPHPVAAHKGVTLKVEGPVKAPVNGNGHGGNGHGHGGNGHAGKPEPVHAEPELAAAGASRGGDIPMEGDFKRF
jgi:methyl-accepting chemotaxis protein